MVNMLNHDFFTLAQTMNYPSQTTGDAISEHGYNPNFGAHQAHCYISFFRVPDLMPIQEMR